MILKSYLVENNTNSLKSYICTLFYGENNGLKIDFKNKIKYENKESEVINLFEEDLLNNKNILLSEVNNLSLFTSKKIIFLHELSDKVFNTVENILNKRNEDVQVYIFSKILDKKSKLRALFEKKKELAAIPCYQDNERTLHQYISNKLKNLKGVTPEIINFIMKNSYLDRGIINGEIEKIKTYFTNNHIERNEIESLLNIKDDESFEKIRDATLLGDKLNVNKLIGEIRFQSEENFYYLNQLYIRFSKLLEIQDFNESVKDYEVTLEQIKPRIFWKDKPALLRQLKIWDIQGIQLAINDISKIEILMKRNSQINNGTLIKNLLINLCAQATKFA